MKRILPGSLFALLLCGTAAVAADFDVASVKPNKSGLGGSISGRGGSVRLTKGQLTMENVSLWKALGLAYGIGEDKDYAMSGPDWLKSERYDILAKMPADTPMAEVQAMLKKLLSDRFKLALHHESKELPMYALVVAKGGSKLHEVEAGQPQFSIGRGAIKAQRAPLGMFADRLSQMVDRPVIDMTGLKGAYDFTLEWTPDAPLPAPGEAPAAAAAEGPTVFTAIQEQLGLRLEARKGPIEVLVVDRGERVPTEN